MGRNTVIFTTNIFAALEGTVGDGTHETCEVDPACVVTEPGSHARQSASLLPPAVGRYFPVPQAWHADASLAPMVAEYLPGAQAMHKSDADNP